MREIEKRAFIDGRPFNFEALVEHATGESSIVLCRNESGELRKPSSEWQQVLAALRELGCEVRLAHDGEPLDVVVMDGSLVWCGGIAPLAYPRRDDCALRFVSREVAAELVEALAKSDV